MTTTSTGALASVLAAHNPPNPAPTMTTRGGIAFERGAERIAPSIVHINSKSYGDGQDIFSARTRSNQIRRAWASSGLAERGEHVDVRRRIQTNCRGCTPRDGAWRS